ncbi:MAG: hypothetical protein K9N05_02455 [Candidatus Marinimicrobia bacterium]|nr:hypothetical protein [Candidatus Neomarinimicrobiota bacterium]
MLRQKLTIHFLIILVILPVFFIHCNLFPLGEAPIIDSLYVIEKGDLYNGDTLHIVCSAYDPDQDSLTYQWSCTGGTIVMSLNDTATIVSSESNLNVNCLVSDPSNKTALRNINILLETAEAPIIDSVYVIETENIYIGDTLHVVCSARDPQHGSLEYQWTCTNGTIEGDDSTAVYISESNCFVTITCTVSNEYGSSTDNYTLQVLEPMNNYFPIETGNSWTYESFNYIGEGNSWKWIGSEIWEILEIDSYHYTLDLKIDFKGIMISFDPYNSGQRDTTDVEYSRTIQLSYDGEYIEYDSLLTTSDTPSGFTYEEVAGLIIIKAYEIPRYLDNNDDTVHIVKYYLADWEQFYWDMGLNIGIVKAEYNSSNGTTTVKRKIELISTSF